MDKGTNDELVPMFKVPSLVICNPTEPFNVRVILEVKGKFKVPWLWIYKLLNEEVLAVIVRGYKSNPFNAPPIWIPSEDIGVNVFVLRIALS